MNRRAFGLIAATFAVTGLLLAAPSGFERIGAGPAAAVTVTGAVTDTGVGEPGRGVFLAVSVTRRPLRFWQLFGAWGSESRPVARDGGADPPAGPAGQAADALALLLPGSLPQFTLSVGGLAGSSSGLAAALGVYDAFSEGDLTGGGRIAATGTVRPDGTIGPVTGVAAKAWSAAAAGAELLLVPATQAEEALRAGAPVQIIGVADIRQAVAALTGR